MKLLNKDNKSFNVMGIFVIFTLISFLIMNLFLYKRAVDFAKEYGATDIKVGYVEKHGQEKYLTDRSYTFFGFSLFEFYKDGVDIVKEKDLYDEYNKFNLKNYNHTHSILLLQAIIFACSCLGLYICVTKRYFAHSFILGFFLTFLFITLDLRVYLHPVYSSLTVLVLLSIVYFLSKTRFCDYNESRLTGIFK